MSGLEIPSIEEIDRIILKKNLEASLLEFTKHFFKVHKKEDFIENWHHHALCDALMEVYNGETQFLIINIPPRYSKTEIVVKNFMAWCMARDPSNSFIHLSYSAGLALDNSSATKELMQSDEYQRLWNIPFSKNSKSKQLWYTEAMGGVYATSTGGQITGFGAGSNAEEGFHGAVIIDDPLKPTDASSDVIRENINQRFNNTIKSRLNNPRKTPIIVIMQRIHEDDFSGFLLNGGSEYTFKHLNLPAINEDGPNEYDPRNVGEALWPTKHNTEQLEAMSSKDQKTYSGQYQQRPSPKEGNTVKRDWIKFYKELPDKFLFKVHSWDCTFKKTDTSDYVVGTVIGKTRMDYYLLDCFRQKLGFVETKRAIKNMIDKHPRYNAVLIEDKANGTAIIETLRESINKIVAVNPTESKEARFEAVSDIFASGNIYFPHPDICPWIEEFIDELLVFPNGKHDDRVDSISQGLNHIENKTRSSIYKMTN